MQFQIAGDFLIKCDAEDFINNTYTVPAGEVGDTISARVTFSNQGGNVQSAPTVAVTAPLVDPTAINFGSTTTYYTYPGRVFPVNYILTPSNAGGSGFE